MTEAQFWDLIDRSRRDWNAASPDGNMDRQRARLQALLSAQSTDDVRGFAETLAAVFNRAYRADLWDAADIITAGCSDDWFDYFRYWLISMGRGVYEGAIANPDSLAFIASRPDVEDVFFEDFGSIAADALEARGVPADGAFVAPAQPAGARCPLDELPARFPQLWSQFRSR
jgi:hypothetical protein